jgi:phosphate transport system substrate-binding protein
MPAPVCEIPSGTPEGAGQPYQIQAGDWLSSIAEREYGNPLDYRAIVRYTNQKCQAGEYNCIENPSIIRTGWTVYLPTPDEVDAYWQGIVKLPEVDFGVGGDIEVPGSSTVYLLTRHLAACFQAGGFDGQIQVESTGTGAGFEAFCVQGQADLVDASRPVGKDELEACRSNGREPVAFQVGTDAIAVVVSQQNEFAQDLTLEELQQVLATASMWSEVRAEWPAEPIKRFYPTEASGTFDVLVNLLFGGEKGPLLEAANVIKQSEDDQELATAIQEGAYGVGFFGYAYYQRHQDALRTLPVEGIQPRPETVDEGTYPLIRPLFIYTTEDLVRGEPQVAAFINFYLRYAKHYIVDIGYFLPDEGALTGAIQVYLDMIE